jgi:hypothetical protein
MIGVLQTWVQDLPSLREQSVLMLALRGPDNIGKSHPCKDVQRAYRATVMLASYGRPLKWGEAADSFMSMDLIADYDAWTKAVIAFFRDVDQLPHHFTMHLMHGAEIIGYKHPDIQIRSRWSDFYRRATLDMHVTPETEFAMDIRLADFSGPEDRAPQ